MDKLDCAVMSKLGASSWSGWLATVHRFLSKGNRPGAGTFTRPRSMMRSEKRAELEQASDSRQFGRILGGISSVVTTFTTIYTTSFVLRVKVTGSGVPDCRVVLHADQRFVGCLTPSAPNWS